MKTLYKYLSYLLFVILLILLVSIILFFYDLLTFDGYYLYMDWYERDIVVISSYLIYPLRYMYKHVILSMITGSLIYGYGAFSLFKLSK